MALDTVKDIIQLLTFAGMVLMLFFRAGIWTRSVDPAEMKRTRERLHLLEGGRQLGEGRMTNLEGRIERNERDIQKLFELDARGGK